MTSSEPESNFQDIVGPLEEELETLKANERDAAFQVEARPIPEGMIADGLPAGHIALKGDFDAPKTEDPTDSVQ